MKNKMKAKKKRKKVMEVMEAVPPSKQDFFLLFGFDWCTGFSTGYFTDHADNAESHFCFRNDGFVCVRAHVVCFGPVGKI